MWFDKGQSVLTFKQRTGPLWYSDMVSTQTMKESHENNMYNWQLGPLLWENISIGLINKRRNYSYVREGNEWNCISRREPNLFQEQHKIRRSRWAIATVYKAKQKIQALLFERLALISLGMWSNSSLLVIHLASIIISSLNIHGETNFYCVK